MFRVRRSPRWGRHGRLAQTDKGLIVGTVRYMCPSRLRACHFHEPPTGTVSASCCTRHWRGSCRTRARPRWCSRRSGCRRCLRPTGCAGHSRRAAFTLYQAAEMQSGGTPDLLGDRVGAAQGGQSPAQRYPAGRYTTEQPFVGRESELCRLSDRVSLPEGRGIGGRAGARAIGERQDRADPAIPG